MLDNTIDMQRLRWRVTEWALAHLRGDIAYADQLKAAALAEGASRDDFCVEVNLLVAEFRGRTDRELWRDLACREAKLAGLGGLPGA